LKKISELGGKVVVPKNMVGDMGAYAQFEDLEGNRIGLFEIHI
jgi:predicted enzyme related to lactoylglutathione lyase